VCVEVALSDGRKFKGIVSGKDASTEIALVEVPAELGNLAIGKPAAGSPPSCEGVRNTDKIIKGPARKPWSGKKADWARPAQYQPTVDLL